jgi:hypothetical protein
MSASRIFVPPLLVFPRKNMKLELLDGTPPVTIGVCHPSGRIQLEIFAKWFQHFIVNVKPSPDDPVLLVLDGHYSHTKNIEITDMARANGVAIVCLPPHSTHKMQPLDVSFMSPFKTYYGQEIERWLKQHGNRIVTTYQIGELMGNAYLQAARVQVAVNGFRKTGLYPCNRNIFDDQEFAEDAAVLDSTSSASHSCTAAGDISPVPHLHKCSAEIKNIATPRRGSAMLITGSPHKNKLMENSKRDRKQKKTSRTIEKKS